MRGISTASRKAKGRQLQQEVRDAVYETYPHLQPGDVESTAMGQSGEDVKLSPAARAVLPYSFECKRKKTFAIYPLYDQAVANSGDREPVLVIRADRKKALAVLDFKHFMEMTRYVQLAKKKNKEDSP